MQPRPTAIEILTVVAEVLERDIVPALGGPAQHHARVAASLVGIVERELRLGPAQTERELTALRAALPDVDVDAADLVGARARFADALRSGSADDPAAEAATWASLFASVRDDLAISKPGHDGWQGD
jgi:hypothetical protein